MLIHGWPITGYEWRHVARELAKTHRVVVPDYRGAGLSSVPNSGYDAATMGQDMIALLDHLGMDRVHVVGHDLGMQSATAMALLAGPQRVVNLFVLESVLPSMKAYKWALENGDLGWHFPFHADVDLATDLTAGQELRYFNMYFEKIAYRLERMPLSLRRYYAANYARDDRLRAGYRIYGAFKQSGEFFKSRLSGGRGTGVPTTVLCAEFSMANHIDLIAEDLGTQDTRVLARTGHFIPDENPEGLLREMRDFWRTARL